MEQASACATRAGSMAASCPQICRIVENAAGRRPSPDSRGCRRPRCSGCTRQNIEGRSDDASGGAAEGAAEDDAGGSAQPRRPPAHGVVGSAARHAWSSGSIVVEPTREVFRQGRGRKVRGRQRLFAVGRSEAEAERELKNCPFASRSADLQSGCTTPTVCGRAPDVVIRSSLQTSRS